VSASIRVRALSPRVCAAIRDATDAIAANVPRGNIYIAPNLKCFSDYILEDGKTYSSAAIAEASTTDPYYHGGKARKDFGLEFREGALCTTRNSSKSWFAWEKSR
jgi:hypothetical protein